MNARKILVSIGFNYLGVITISLLGFLATPIILHHLGHAVFGQWGLLVAVIGYSSLLDFGIGLTVMRLVAERSHLSDRQELKSITSTALMMYTALGLIVGASGLIAAQFVGPAFHVHGPRAGSFSTALMIMAVVMAITFPAGLYSGINLGFGHYKQQNLIVIGQNIGGTVSGVAAVLLGGGLVGLTASWTVFAILGFLAKTAYARHAFELTPSLREFDRSAARLLTTTGIWMFIINIAGKLILDTDVIIVGAILGPVNVARYTVALGPATSARGMTDQFSSVSLTAAAGYRARDERESLRRLLLESTRGALIVIGPVLVLCVLWGRQFLRLWVGPSLEGSAATLVVLIAGMLAASMMSTAAQVLIALGRQRVIALLSIGVAVANITLSILLAHQIGIVGVAIGTTVPNAVAAFGFFIPYAARLLDLRLREIMLRLTLPAGICMLAYVIGRLAVTRVVFSSLAEFAAFGVCFLGLLVAASILLDPKERGTYLSVLTAWRHSSTVPRADADSR